MSTKRDKVLETAVELFRSGGYRATGVDRIVAESGVAKMTLYNHFKSKEELILAALRRWDEESRNWLMRAIEERSSTPAGRLIALFDVLDEWFESDEFNGCMFISASAEFADPDDPIHAAAKEHKRLFRRYLHKLAISAELPSPDELATQLVLLMEGAIVTAQVNSQSGSGAQAKQIAKMLIASRATDHCSVDLDIDNETFMGPERNPVSASTG